MWGASHFTKLYTAPGQLMDYCDSSGCLPGQTPLPGVGLSDKSILSKAASNRMAQVSESSGCSSGVAGFHSVSELTRWLCSCTIALSLHGGFGQVLQLAQACAANKAPTSACT
jgi:hypothetical protein